MPEGKQVEETDIEQLRGPRYSYDPENEVFEIRIEVGGNDVVPDIHNEDPELYGFKTQDNELSIVRYYDQGAKSDEKLDIIGPGDHWWTLYTFNLGESKEFDGDYISAGIPQPDRDPLEMLVRIHLPNGIVGRSLTDLARDIDLEDVLIPVDEDILEGDGLDSLQKRAELTDFEIAVVRTILQNQVQGIAQAKGFEIQEEIETGLVNVIAKMMAMEIVAGGGSDV